MARPRRSEHTRAALIEEGIAQLSAQGYHGTGIKQILDAVQVPKGSFYNFFESKEAYVAEIVNHYGSMILEDLDRHIASCGLGPMETLRSIFDRSIARYEAQHCERGCLVGTLAAEIGTGSSLCQLAMQQAAGRWEARIAGLVTRAQEAGQIRTDMTARTVGQTVVEQLGRSPDADADGRESRSREGGGGHDVQDHIAQQISRSFFYLPNYKTTGLIKDVKIQLERKRTHEHEPAE